MRPGGATFQHVVCDLDGTLVDTKDDLAEGVNVALRALGLPARDPATLWGFVGDGARVLLERALGPAAVGRVEEALAVFMPWYRAHLLDHAVVYPGVRATMDRLAADGVIFSVLTNKPADMSAAVLRGLRLHERAPRLIGGDTLPVKKPDPSGLRRLAYATGVPLAATLMLGDSAVDVATARNAGVPSCAVSWGFNGARVRASGPDVCVATPAELLAVCCSGIGDPGREVSRPPPAARPRA